MSSYTHQKFHESSGARSLTEGAWLPPGPLLEPPWLRHVTVLRKNSVIFYNLFNFIIVFSLVLSRLCCHFIARRYAKRGIYRRRVSV